MWKYVNVTVKLVKTFEGCYEDLLLFPGLLASIVLLKCAWTWSDMHSNAKDLPKNLIMLFFDNPCDGGLIFEPQHWFNSLCYEVWAGIWECTDLREFTGVHSCCPCCEQYTVACAWIMPIKKMVFPGNHKINRRMILGHSLYMIHATKTVTDKLPKYVEGLVFFFVGSACCWWPISYIGCLWDFMLTLCLLVVNSHCFFSEERRFYYSWEYILCHHLN